MHPISRRPSLLPFIAILLLLISPSRLFAQATTQPQAEETDRWYRVKLGNLDAGWSRLKVQLTSDGKQIQTVEEVHITLRRAGTPIRMDISSSTLESPDGTPISLTLSEYLGDAVTTTSITLQPGQFIVTRGRGDDQIREVIPDKTVPAATAPSKPSPQHRFLPAAAARRYLLAQIARHAAQVDFPTLDPSAAIAVKNMHMVRGETQTLQVMGKPVSATLWTQTLAGFESLPEKSWLDDQAYPVRMSVSLLPGLEMICDQCNQADAQASISPQELLISTLITPDHPIDSPRKLRQGEFELHFSEVPDARSNATGEANFKSPRIPRTGAQRVVWDNRSTALVIVDLDDPTTPESDLPRDIDLKPSLLIDFENPKVKAVLADADKAIDVQNPAAKASPPDLAEALRKFVYNYIKNKDLSVGLGSASETCDSQRGDCTEHAVLLAALLRASKIPSRAVMGLVYADAFAGRKGIYGYHMWTQAWLDLPNDDGQKAGRWVDLDPTLSLDQPFDATHIALLVTSLGDDDRLSEKLAGLTPVIGRTSINVTVPAVPNTSGLTLPNPTTATSPTTMTSGQPPTASVRPK